MKRGANLKSGVVDADPVFETLAHRRLERAALVLAAILVTGKRDPRWPEQTEIEEAAINLYRARCAARRTRKTK